MKESDENEFWPTFGLRWFYDGLMSENCLQQLHKNSGGEEKWVDVPIVIDLESIKRKYQHNPYKQFNSFPTQSQ